MTHDLMVNVQTLPHFEGLTLPAYATKGAAGLDLPAAIDEPVDLLPGQRMLIATGLRMALPSDFEAQIRPRSGLALKHGVTVLNSPGTVDCDYRGEMKVLLINHGDTSFRIERGMRIAQMVVAPVTQLRWNAVTALDETERGAGGYGSTGVDQNR